MPLAVIGAGLFRTGTMSLKAALERLGKGPCYHMTELFQNPEHVPLWHTAIDRAAAGDTIDWDAILDGYASTSHWPACAFYRELAAHDPESKVVLSVRDPERWYESVSETSYRIARQRVEHRQPWRELQERLIWRGLFDDRFHEREHALAVFERHAADVREHVPPERLLEWSVEEGWEPLCAFLDAPVPDEAFPHLNDRAAFAEIAERLDRPPSVEP